MSDNVNQNDVGDDLKAAIIAVTMIVVLLLIVVVIYFLQDKKDSDSKSEVVAQTETNVTMEITTVHITRAKEAAQEYVAHLKETQGNIKDISYRDSYETMEYEEYGMIYLQYIVTYENDSTLRHVCDLRVKVYDDCADVLGMDVVYTLDSDG